MLQNQAEEAQVLVATVGHWTSSGMGPNKRPKMSLSRKDREQFLDSTRQPGVPGVHFSYTRWLCLIFAATIQALVERHLYRLPDKTLPPSPH